MPTIPTTRQPAYTGKEFKRKLMARIRKSHKGGSLPPLYELAPGIITLHDRGFGDFDTFFDPDQFQNRTEVGPGYMDGDLLYVPNAGLLLARGLANVMRALERHIVFKPGEHRTGTPDLPILPSTPAVLELQW
ncbi:hypothetical protein COB55_02120 [Candidatus Wolfebacteria bacterium]|nr:MAG: hypothetical protein COB55_02120 [Candidatus Wolfebacteria bacterium]